MASTDLKDDLLTGADSISEYLGEGWPVRRVYYVAAKKYLPIGRVGAILTARKSELDRALSAKSDEAA